MAVSVEWEIKGIEFANCNCAYGCGCQFNALPDKGFREAVAGYQIQQGNFGDVRLDGLRAAAMWRWPGAVHEGNGVMQIVIDERADARQRDALAQILSGQETEDMATVWWVFSAMCPTKHEPLFHPIHFDVDVDARRARLEIPGLVRSVGEPIRNPVTGAQLRPSRIRKISVEMAQDGGPYKDLHNASHLPDTELAKILADECHSLKLAATIIYYYVSKANECASDPDANKNKAHCPGEEDQNTFAARNYIGQRRTTSAIIDYAPIAASVVGSVSCKSAACPEMPGVTSAAPNKPPQATQQDPGPTNRETATGANPAAKDSKVPPKKDSKVPPNKENKKRTLGSSAKPHK